MTDEELIDLQAGCRRFDSVIAHSIDQVPQKLALSAGLGI
jgi:hypothetical protein